MSEDVSKDQAPQAADQEKLEEIVQKDAKTGRPMSGFWFWLTSSMGAFMVLFYMYAAGVEPVDTQYFLGVYVLITYVLVFLNYPISSGATRPWSGAVDGAISIAVLGTAGYYAAVFLVKGMGEDAFAVDSAYKMVAAGVTVVAAALTYRWWSRPHPERPGIMDLLLALVAVFVVGYFVLEYEALNYRMGSETPLDTAVSIVGILVSLEVARRVLGWSMTIVGIAFLVYAFWGDALSNVPVLSAFAHTGFELDRAINHIYLKQEGVFGIMATVLVTYVILFIFFGSFLKSSGASRFFLDLPMALAGRTTGGPAKVAVIASGFFGSVSGSAIANTVSTGAFTIPLMKKAGFRPHVAGAIEPSASIGGMFMPPIMGAGGFIMAEMTEIPYVDIMLIAVFPAIIYFLSVFVMIHFEAKRYGLVGIREENAPTARMILKEQWFMSLPLLVIVVLMLMGHSPGLAAYWAILSCIVAGWVAQDPAKGYRLLVIYAAPAAVTLVLLNWLSLAVAGAVGAAVFLAAIKLVRPARAEALEWVRILAPPAVVLALILLRPDEAGVAGFGGMLAYALICLITRDPQKRHKEIIEPMIEGARNTLIIGATVGVIGIIVGTIALTGIGLKFSQIIIELSGGILPVAIILIGLASLVLGMGVPVTAAYLITAVLAVGAVSNMISQQAFGVGFSELQLPLGELLADDPERAILSAKIAWVLIASHMIVYWFSQDSNITPPVCVAAYAGAAIAGSDPWKTGWTSFKFAKMLYVGPFLFAFSPGFLLGGPGNFATWYDIVLAMLTIILGTIAFGSLTMGYLLCSTTIVEWFIFAVATALLFFPELLPWALSLGDSEVYKLMGDALGLGLWFVVYLMQKVRVKRDPSLLLPIAERKAAKQQPA